MFGWCLMFIGRLAQTYSLSIESVLGVMRACQCGFKLTGPGTTGQRDGRLSLRHASRLGSCGVEFPPPPGPQAHFAEHILPRRRRILHLLWTCLSDSSGN